MVTLPLTQWPLDIVHDTHPVKRNICAKYKLLQSFCLKVYGPDKVLTIMDNGDLDLDSMSLDIGHDTPPSHKEHL